MFIFNDGDTKVHPEVTVSFIEVVAATEDVGETSLGEFECVTFFEGHGFSLFVEG